MEPQYSSGSSSATISNYEGALTLAFNASLVASFSIPPTPPINYALISPCAHSGLRNSIADPLTATFTLNNFGSSAVTLKVFYLVEYLRTTETTYSSYSVNVTHGPVVFYFTPESENSNLYLRLQDYLPLSHSLDYVYVTQCQQWTANLDLSGNRVESEAQFKVNPSRDPVFIHFATSAQFWPEGAAEKSIILSIEKKPQDTYQQILNNIVAEAPLNNWELAFMIGVPLVNMLMLIGYLSIVGVKGCMKIARARMNAKKKRDNIENLFDDSELAL